VELIVYYYPPFCDKSSKFSPSCRLYLISITVPQGFRNVVDTTKLYCKCQPVVTFCFIYLIRTVICCGALPHLSLKMDLIIPWHVWGGGEEKCVHVFGGES
jgi:hypothetical protein